MDIRRISNWNVLSVEAALQQLNVFEGDDAEKIVRRPNTVSGFTVSRLFRNYQLSVSICVYEERINAVKLFRSQFFQRSDRLLLMSSSPSQVPFVISNWLLRDSK